MTQITRETAIALAKEAGMAGMLTDVVCSLEEIHRLCNLAVAHSRKDAEPVDIRAAMKKAFNLGQTYWQQADSEYVSQQNKSDATRAQFNELLESTVTNADPQPEADKLLQQALEAFDAILYWRKGGVSIERTVESIRTYLEIKNA